MSSDTMCLRTFFPMIFSLTSKSKCIVHNYVPTSVSLGLSSLIEYDIIITHARK